MTTWADLSTRRGQLIEMAAALSSAKGKLEDVLQDYPAELDGLGQLEHAIALVGQAEAEIDAAAEASHA